MPKISYNRLNSTKWTSKLELDLGETYWSNRYQSYQIGWDAGKITPPLKAYFDQLENKKQRILIPGCGSAYEAQYLAQHGFNNVYLLDISPMPLKKFKLANPKFPEEYLIQADFFDYKGSFDLIIEQTFFCSLDPELRSVYAGKMFDLLEPGKKLVGLFFDDDLIMVRDRPGPGHPPYGGHKDEYVKVFEDYFQIEILETCYNSLPPRQGRELFAKFIRKDQNSST